MKKILAITGNAGTGKDTIARWLAEHEDWNMIVSYTTRPMREGEEQGREHWFTEQMLQDAQCRRTLAYTRYGDYEYWTTWDQLLDDTVNIYVIDEKGLYDLLEARAATGMFELVTMHVTADEDVRLKRGVTLERMARDATRDNPLKYFRYDYEIKNNKSMAALRHTLRDIAEKMEHGN